MTVYRCVFVVIQAGAAHVFVIHGKTKRLDQVKRTARVGCKTDDIARVGWNFGMDQNNIEHGRIVQQCAEHADQRLLDLLSWSRCPGKDQSGDVRGPSRS